MEPDKFDELFSKKLQEADVPAYNESAWKALRGKLSSVGGARVNLANLFLISLLVLSNSWWAWSAYESQNEVGATATEVNDFLPSIEMDHQIVTIYDTVVRKVMVREASGPKRTGLNPPGQEANVAGFGSEQDKPKSVLKEIPGLANTDESEEKEISESSVESMKTKPEEKKIVADTVSDQQKKVKAPVVPVKKKKVHQPYTGPRWMAGLDFHKPMASRVRVSNQYEGSAIGLNINYAVTGWLALSAEISRWNYGYFITDVAFYNDVKEVSDPVGDDSSESIGNNGSENNDPGGVYGGDNADGTAQEPGGETYGSTYTWQNSEVKSVTTQLGVSMRLSIPIRTRLRPYGSVGYFQNHQTSSDVANRLEENGTGKIVRVETYFPNGQTNNSYLRYELGVQGQINQVWGVSISADFWNMLNGQAYESDLFGLKAGLIYTIK